VIIFRFPDDCGVALGRPVDVSLADSQTSLGPEASGLFNFLLQLLALLESLSDSQPEAALVISRALREMYAVRS